MSFKTEESKKLFIDKYNCGQTVLAVFSEESGLDKNAAVSLACGLGGGFCSDEVCGAVAGAILTIGLKCGNISAQNNVNREYTYQKTQEFIKNFKETHGSILCKDLFLEHKRPNKNHDKETSLKIYKESCTSFVEDAISIVENMNF